MNDTTTIFQKATLVRLLNRIKELFEEDIAPFSPTSARPVTRETLLRALLYLSFTLFLIRLLLPFLFAPAAGPFGGHRPGVTPERSIAPASPVDPAPLVPELHHESTI